MKILYQGLWEEKLDWYEVVPDPYVTMHCNWRTELLVLTTNRYQDATLKQQPRAPFNCMDFQMPLRQPMRPRLR